MRTRVIVLLATLVVAAGAVARANRYETVAMRTPLSGLPLEIAEWRGQEGPPFTDSVLAVLGATDYLNRIYFSAPKQAVGLYIGYWGSQRQGDAIHSPQNCLPGAGWEAVSQTHISFPDPRTPGAPPVSVNRYLVQKGLERQLVMYWYQSHGRIVASEYWSKFYLVADAVRMNRSDGAIVRVIAPVDGTTAEAEARAEAQAVRFATALLPHLDHFLPN